MRRIHLLLWIIGLGFAHVSAQDIQQTIRGYILDQDTQTPIIGANVIVVDSDPIIGASTDVDGYFRLEGVPIGRVTLLISSIGYEQKVMPGLLLNSAKELVLDVTMQESIQEMEEIVIKANQDKTQSIDEMALISARMFSVEETERYAGSLNDPARMVSSFAGVTSDPAGNNDIVVRGNSPRGIQWRLEGIEIPNPNHFSDEGSTGGPINALNSSMLANSDFYTGAFAPPYGHALSGIFDMKLRQGNNEQREYAITAGVLGLEANLEGPFHKNSHASYLVNYRYSSLALMDELGILDFGGVPKYQDASFKLALPSKKLGKITVFGLGGLSNFSQNTLDDDDEEIIDEIEQNAHIGVLGINHIYSFSDPVYLESVLAVSANGSDYLYKEWIQDDFIKTNEMELAKSTLSLNSNLHYKLNARHKLQAGIGLQHQRYQFDLTNYNLEAENYRQELAVTDQTQLWQGYVSHKFRISSAWTMVSGLHALYFSLTNKSAIEPRWQLQWQVNKRHAFTGGFGLHSKTENLGTYSANVLDGDEITQPNFDLGFTKAAHAILAYRWAVSPKLNLKLEAYYQYLYQAPIEDDPKSSYSILNSSAGYEPRALVNQGTGENIGLELTLERFLTNRFYYMLTTSVFDAKYVGGDGITRDTRFNGQYAGNLLIGKEFSLKSRKKERSIGLNAKLSLIGGKPFTPINLDKSIEMGYEVLQDEPLSQIADDVFQLNVAIMYRVNGRKTSQELKLDIQNATNNQAKVDEYYVPSASKIENLTQLSMVPVLSYTLFF